MGERRNPNHLWRRRIVIATVLWTVFRKKFIQHVRTEIRGTANATIWKWSLDVKRQLDQMFERTAKFLQIRFYIREYRAPLHCGAANGTASLVQRIIILSRGRVASKKNVSFRTRDDRGLSPRHQTITFKFLVRCEVH